MHPGRSKKLGGKNGHGLGLPKLPLQPIKQPPSAPESVFPVKELVPPPPEYISPKQVEVPQHAYHQDPAKFVHTSPTPNHYSKLRYFFVIAGFLFVSLFSAFLLVMTSSSSNQNHQMGKQPHLSRTYVENQTEFEAYWDFSVTNGLQTWQEIPAKDSIPGIYVSKGSVQKFEVSCTTADGISLTKGVGFDALSFDARLRYLPNNGELKLLFYANNIQLLQSTCTLFVKIKPQF